MARFIMALLTDEVIRLAKCYHRNPSPASLRALCAARLRVERVAKGGK